MPAHLPTHPHASLAPCAQRSLRLCRGLLVIAALLTSGWAPNAYAQGSTSSARALFNEGVALTDQGEWSEAADRFSRALELKDSPVIRFNLASALAEAGQLVAASERAREVIHSEEADDELKQEARALLDGIEPRVPRLTVNLVGDGDLDQVLVELDEHPLVPAQIGVALPVDPGPHRVRAGLRVGAGLGGEPLDLADIHVAEGASETVALRVGTVATPQQAAAMDVAATDDGRKDATPKDIRRRRIVWGSIAAGVVVVAAVVVGVLASGSSAGGGSGVQGDFDPPTIGVEVNP